MITYDKLYIDGDWVTPSGNATIDVICPHTEEVIGRTPEATETDIDRAVAAARAAFDDGPWPRTTPAERAAMEFGAPFGGFKQSGLGASSGRRG